MTDYVAERAGAALGRPTAWWGMAILVASEATLFARADRHVLLPPLQDRRRGRRAGSQSRRLVVPADPARVLVATEHPDAARRARGAARAGSARTRCFVLVALVVQAGYFAYAGARLRRPDSHARRSRATPTARSTTRCSAPTTRTSSSGCSSTSGSSRSSPRGLTTYRRERRAGDHAVLALPSTSSRSSSTLGASSRPRAMSAAPALGVLQWVGLLGGAAASGAAQLPSSAYGVTEADVRRRRRALGDSERRLAGSAARGSRLPVVLAAELAAVTVFVARRAASS